PPLPPLPPLPPTAGPPTATAGPPLLYGYQYPQYPPDPEVAVALPPTALPPLPPLPPFADCLMVSKTGAASDKVKRLIAKIKNGQSITTESKSANAQQDNQSVSVGGDSSSYTGNYGQAAAVGEQIIMTANLYQNNLHTNELQDHLKF
ncbi:13419_t:CDS:2, partial [Ambispora leptoticha]